MSNHFNSDTKRLFLILAWIGALIILFIILVYTLGEGILVSEVAIQGLVICPETNKDCDMENTQLETGTQSLFISGILQSNIRDVRLEWIVRRKSDNEMIYYDMDLTFPPGSFSYKIVFKERLKEGDYCLYVYFGREKLAELDFQVVP